MTTQEVAVAPGVFDQARAEAGAEGGFDQKVIEALSAEMIDRFGPLPEEAEHLLAVMRIKLLCRLANIERIDAGPKGAVISFYENRFAQPEKLLSYIDRHARYLKARPDQKLVYTQEWKNDEEKMAAIKKLAAEIARLLT